MLQATFVLYLSCPVNDFARFLPGSVVGAVKNQKVVLDWGGDDWDSQGSDGWSTNDGSYKSQGGGDSRNNYTGMIADHYPVLLKEAKSIYSQESLVFIFWDCTHQIKQRIQWLQNQ